MMPYLKEKYGNPGSIHAEGVFARKAVHDAREKIARALHSVPGEIIFTSGATEANNLAILGFANSLSQYGKNHNKKFHIITSAIEHHSVMEPIKKLEREGAAEVTWLPVYENGAVRPEDVKKVLRSETVLVSVMYANNEIGTIQPIKEIARIVRDWRREKQSQFPQMHTDGAQAPGALPVMMDSLGVDMASFGAQKFYGPKGVGFLYKKKNIDLAALLYGGDQEGKLRAGTENVPSIVGMAEALFRAEEGREKEVKRLISLRDYFIGKVQSEIRGAELNGSIEDRLPGNVNFSFAGVEGEQMVIELDARGIAVGTGSACTSESTGPSHVLLALGGGEERARGGVRFSLGKDVKKRDLDYVLKCLKQILSKQESVRSL